jgi:hypothetical protein
MCEKSELMDEVCTSCNCLTYMITANNILSQDTYMAPVCLPSFVFDSLLLFRFSPLLVRSVLREVVKAEIQIFAVMLRAGTVQHSLPVKLLFDLVELAVMQLGLPVQVFMRNVTLRIENY